jgi:ABC-type glycerol-3-phosphate transport system substrate-binding protein
MMFYRKDIVKELGLKLPTTWDEVKVIMSVLAKNQMEFAMLPSENLFASILNQNGGLYYTDGAFASALDEEEAIRAFKEYCAYYTDYKLDPLTSVQERFRTGEAPLIIEDFGFYNILQVSAPEIAGMWGFTTVPGTVQADGSVNHTVASTGSASVILKAALREDKTKQAAWEFIKWWTEAESQTMYGREMESLMGAAARVPTANKEAFANLPWPVADYKAILEQSKYVRGIPQVPGGYFTFRNVNNAFYRVTTNVNTATPREELTDNVIFINDEITFKRLEFGLPVE